MTTTPTCILTEADILAGRDDDCSLHDHEPLTGYAGMLEALVKSAQDAAGVEGGDAVGAFHPIPTGEYRGYGEFSSLSEFLDDFADVLQDFLDSDGEELEGWSA